VAVFVWRQALKSTFNRALAHILKFEGGYVDHPLDPGGATNLGITRRTLEQALGRSVSKAEVRALDTRTAGTIYRRQYWDEMACDLMPAGLDLAVFDCAVNQGVGRARRLLQQALGVRADGIIGPITLAAIKRADPSALLSEFMARRMRAYASLTRLFSTFGLGWSRRLMSVHGEALRLIYERQAKAATAADMAAQNQAEPTSRGGAAPAVSAVDQTA
jgi:lysozyme family protein